MKIMLAAMLGAAVVAGAAEPQFKKLQLSDQFYCEGAWYADFNHDGKLDVVSGPYWYQGPDFAQRHQIRAATAFNPTNYSDNFLTFCGDFNNDGWADLLYMPYPNKEAFWYENPAGKGTAWKKHLAFPVVDNESPMLGHLTDPKKPQMIFNTGGCMGFAEPDFNNPDATWNFTAVTTNCGFHKFTHGLGVGDVNGDGRPDLLEANGWWEQPKDWKTGDLFIRHKFNFAPAACQMFVADVDGDGLNDIITVLHCHHYGLAWYKQARNAQGEISFECHEILSPKPDLASPALRISQMHGMAVLDMNGDGLPDILTGKRFWAHGPKGDKEPDAPAVVYWFELRRDKEKGAQFIPHQIDDNSGVGTQVTAADLNGDGTPDVIVGNKKGTFIHLSQPAR